MSQYKLYVCDDYELDGDFYLANTGHLLQLLTQKTQEEEIGNAVRIVKDEMIIVATRKKWHLAV
jgi:hypothetical protein